MINIDKQKWDFTKEENFAINWFDSHGFTVILQKQYISKTIFIIQRDGIEDKFELSSDIELKALPKYMEQLMKDWERRLEIQKLRKLVAQA